MAFKAIAAGLIAASVAVIADFPAAAAEVATGAAALKDWHDDAPGVRRRITSADLAAPANNKLLVVPRPATSSLKVPAGFTVQEFASGLSAPRLVRAAPNGDIFVVESVAGTVLVMRADDGAAKPKTTEVFATGLDQPFGVAFYPAVNPQWLYVANANSVVRFPYRSGDLKARAGAETVIAKLTETVGGHVTRDVAFSRDGKRMFVSVGSSSDAAEGLAAKSAAEVHEWESAHGFGAAWDNEAGRADVLAFDPKGGGRKLFASGIRNCVGLAVHPISGEVWCSINERDSVGDERIADYITRVKEGAFYGWPWYYVGNNEDLRHKGERPDLAGKVTPPDVLFQPHSAPLTMTFYDAAPQGPAAFPAEYRGDAFVAFHGTINDGKTTGAKVVRVHTENGVAAGDYEDFVTGFLIDDTHVWGRPVGLTVAHDGALLVTDDAAGTMWRVAYTGKH